MTDWRTWWWLGFAPVAVGVAACWQLYAAEPRVACFILGACTAEIVVWCWLRNEAEWREYEAIRPILDEIRRASAAPARARLEVDLRRHLALIEIQNRDPKKEG